MKHRSEADAVLSSVRQLVTQEQRKPEGAENGAKVERLLLTPALRVDAPKASAPLATPVRHRRDPSPLEARIAELERAVGGVSGDWEPDGSEAIDEETPMRFVFSPPHDETTAPMSARSEDAAPVAGRVDEATEDLGGVPEMPDIPRSAEVARRDDTDSVQVFDGVEIDEEHLREIVAQMVRAELQGELGERITRNVRKLVRREIHQALLTRNLD